MAHPVPSRAPAGDSILTVEEARVLGITRGQLRSRRWRRIERGSYTPSRLPETPLLLLASVLRRLPSSAAFSGRTAAWLLGLDLPPCDPVEVTVPYGCGVSGRAGIALRRADLDREEVISRRGFPLTDAIRTVTDLGRRLAPVDAVIAADMALNLGLVQLLELEQFVAAHPGEPGIARLRHVIGQAEPAAESPMETRLRLALVGAGLPRPEAQVALHDEAGRFLGRTDLFYPDQRLAIEYDGGNHRDRLVEDDRRQNRILSAGFRLLRFTAPDLLVTPDQTVMHVRLALAQR